MEIVSKFGYELTKLDNLYDLGPVFDYEDSFINRFLWSEQVRNLLQSASENRQNWEIKRKGDTVYVCEEVLVLAMLHENNEFAYQIFMGMFNIVTGNEVFKQYKKLTRMLSG